MDVIAAHQQGLIEQLDAEVEALAGRPRDHAQRAIVLHHLYQHSNDGHVWALAEARRSIRIASGLARLEKRLVRWRWTVRDPAGSHAALDVLADTLGEAARARAIAAYRAYRLSATKALRGEAEASLPPALLQALDDCHSARRDGLTTTAEARRAMAEESEQFAASSVNLGELAAAWAEIDATGIGRSARRLLGEKGLARYKIRDERKGWVRAERELRSDPALPSSFRTNPAQHFYAMQLMLVERRRRQWRKLCDQESDAVALAA